MGGVAYYNDVDVAAIGGSIDAQGTTDPRVKFTDHALVVYNGDYYDPSYGSSYASLDAWVAGALAGIGVTVGTDKYIVKVTPETEVDDFPLD